MTSYKYKDAYRQMLIEESEAGAPATGVPPGVAGTSASYMQQFQNNPKTAAYNTGGSVIIPITKRKMKDYFELKEDYSTENPTDIEEKCKKHLIEFLGEVFDVEEYTTEEMDDEMLAECMMLKLTKKDPNQQDPNPQDPNKVAQPDLNQPAQPDLNQPVQSDPNIRQ